MKENWLDKYYSTDLSDYDNNTNEIKKINELVNNNNNTIIIKGSTGIGKNNILKLVAEKFNYKIKKYKLNDKKTITLNDFYINNISNKKTFLVVNKIDYVTTINEKKNIQELNKLANKNNNNNLIIFFFVEKTITKIVKEINKISELINLNAPTDVLLSKILKKIMKNENLNIDEDVEKNIIYQCQSDIRKLILILKDLKLTFFLEKINRNNYNEFLKFTNLKVRNYNINDTTKIIINNYNYDNAFKYYNNEKVILPLMIYENFINKLKLKKDKKNLLNTIIKISNLITWGDIIETNIYTDQNWYLQKIHGFITIITTSFYINNYDSNNYDLKINFSSDLNKTSLKNINKKNFNNIKNIIINKSIDDILFINNMFYEFVENNNIPLIVKYIKNYNLEYKIFDIIIKVNKLKKITINSIQKKKINNLIK